MAKVIVRRAATQTTDRAELCSILSESISDPESRQRFVEAFTRSGGTQSVAGGSLQRSGSVSTAQSRGGSRAGTASAALVPIDPAYIEAVAAKLAVHIGPIARVLARNAAGAASSREDFLRRCAEQLDADARTRFLREAG